MAIQVYSIEKPAVQRRALIASILLLLLASCLAAAMTWARSSDAPGPRVEPEGWSISFRPPRRFNGTFGLTTLGPAYQFDGSARPEGVAILVVYRLGRRSADGARDVCERVLGAHFGPNLHPVGTARFAWFDRRLGPLDAVEIWEPLMDVLVRAAVPERGDAYALSVAVRGGRISPETYRLFDQTCRSIEFRTR